MSVDVKEQCGPLVAVIDAGPVGGTGVAIGELLVDGKSIGEVKIPAGLTAIIRLSQADAAGMKLGGGNVERRHVGAERGVRDEDGDLLPGQAPEVEERRRGELHAKYGEAGK